MHIYIVVEHFPHEPRVTVGYFQSKRKAEQEANRQSEIEFAVSYGYTYTVEKVKVL